MEEVNVTINSKEVRCKDGELLLKVARQAGIYIPSLCFHPAFDSTSEIKPSEVIYRGNTGIKGEGINNEFEGCGLCIVAIEGEGIVQACHTAAQEGMVVNTSTPEVQAQRQERIAEILVQHPHECLICDLGEGCTPFQANCPRNVSPNERCCPRYGKCEFEKIAQYVGIKSGIGRFAYPELPIVSDNPLFEHNYNLCVGCLRCVRVCKEVAGAGALGFVFRGNNVIIGRVKATSRESGCKFCGCCVEVCPTGTLTDKDRTSRERKKAREESQRSLRGNLRFSLPKVMLPPDEWKTFNEENVRNVPDIEGVFQLLDENKKIIYILGTDSISRDLEDLMDYDHPLMEKVRYFTYEETSLFTTRQNELIQKFVQSEGSFPPGNEEF